MTMYEIVEDSKYKIKIEEVQLEDCVGVCYSYDELLDMGFIKFGVGEIVKKSVIKSDILELVNSRKDGVDSVVISDELKLVLCEEKISVRDLDSRLKRVGNRIVVENLEKKREKKRSDRTVKHNDWKYFMNICMKLLVEEGMSVEWSVMYSWSSIGCVNIIKRLYSWDQIVSGCNELKVTISDDDMMLFKMLYHENNVEFKKG